MDKDPEISGNKLDNGQFKKGDDPRRNLEGRPVGSRDFATDFDEVVEEIAKENGITKSAARKHLLKVAYKNAKDGNYSFYKDIHDRIYGQPTSKSDVNLKGDLSIQIAEKIANKYANTTPPSTK
jgi:hypothetical protein